MKTVEDFAKEICRAYDATGANQDCWKSILYCLERQEAEIRADERKKCVARVEDIADYDILNSNGEIVYKTVREMISEVIEAIKRGEVNNAKNN